MLTGSDKKRVSRRYRIVPLKKYHRAVKIFTNHLISAQQAERKNKELIHFADDTHVLEEAAKASVEQLHNEIKTLDTRIRALKREIQLPNTQGDIKDQTGDFLQVNQH